MYVSLGTFEATPQIIDRTMGVLKSGRLSYGPESRELEKKFSRKHDSKYGVLSNSGTSSLVVALQAIKELRGWPDGSEVIIPAITFVATANAVLQCKMVPVPCDVCPDYYDLDPYQIGKWVTGKTVAVIAVNVFGKPADLPAISSVCKAHDLILIEDSCEAMGVNIANRPVGSWGTVGVFSFYMAHIAAAGVGGIGITDDFDIAQKMRSLVNHGLTVRNLPGPNRYDPSFLGRNFEFETVGHSFRITELEAAIAIEQLKDLGNIVYRRELVANEYDRFLRKYEDGAFLRLPRVRPNSRSSWMMYPIVMKYQSRIKIMAHLREWDIECRDMLPLVTQPCYDGMFRINLYPEALRIGNCGFYIGCHQDLDKDQLEHVENAFEDFWENNNAYQ